MGLGFRCSKVDSTTLTNSSGLGFRVQGLQEWWVNGEGTVGTLSTPR